MSTGHVQRWQLPDFDPPPSAMPDPEPMAQTAVPEPEPAPQKIGPSVEELAAIEKAARDEGYADGHAEGLAAGRATGQAEVERLQQQLGTLLRSLGAPLADLDQEVGDALGALAVRIAGTLLEEIYVAEPEHLAQLVRATLDTAAMERSGAEVRLHPQDLAVVKPLLVDESVRLVAEPSLKRGDVRVQGSVLRVDAALETRLRSAYAALRVEETPDA